MTRPNANDYCDSTDTRLAEDVSNELVRLGLAEPPRVDRSVMEALGVEEMADAYSIEQLPPDLFDAEVRHFMHAIVRAAYRLEPARNPMMRAVYRMLAKLADEGVQTSPEVVTVALALGAAKVHGIKIGGKANDLASMLGVRYALLLKVRKAAIVELSSLRDSDPIRAD